MLLWQFWTIFGVGLCSLLLILNELAKITEATYRVAQVVIELTDQVKLVQGNTFQIERHTEALEREIYRD